MKIKPTTTRRNVVLDIETISLDPAVPDGALSALTGRIACICLLVDDGEAVTEHAFIDPDEALLLDQFWNVIRPTDLLIGFNLYAFDLPSSASGAGFWECGPPAALIFVVSTAKTSLILCNCGATGGRPSSRASALGCGQKLGHGSDVAQWFAGASISEVAQYCREDARITYKLFFKMMFQPFPRRLSEVFGSDCGCPANDAVASFLAPTGA